MRYRALPLVATAALLAIGAGTATTPTATAAAAPIDSPYVTHAFACVGHPESFVATPSTTPSFVAAVGGSGGGAGQAASFGLGTGGTATGTVDLVGGESLQVQVGCSGGPAGTTTGGAGGWGFGTGGPGGDAGAAGLAGGGGGGGTALLRGARPLVAVGGGGGRGGGAVPDPLRITSSGGNAGCAGLVGVGDSMEAVAPGTGGNAFGGPQSPPCSGVPDGVGAGGTPGGQAGSARDGGSGAAGPGALGGAGGGGGGGLHGAGGGGHGAADPLAPGGSTGGGGGGGGSNRGFSAGVIGAASTPGDGSLETVTLENASRGPYWPGWDIARGVSTYPAGSGGYVLDGFGGIHPFASGSDPLPPAVHGAPYWPGRDIARGIAVLPDGTGGVVLDGYGGLHPFGIGGHAAPTIAGGGPYRPGQDVYRAVAMMPSGEGGIVQDAYGTWFPNFFGVNGHVIQNLVPYPVGPAAWTWPAAHGFAIEYNAVHSRDFMGGYVSDVFGGIHPFGSPSTACCDAQGTFGPPGPVIGGPYWPGWNIARGIATYPTVARANGVPVGGGFELDGFGGLHAFVFADDLG